MEITHKGDDSPKSSLKAGREERPKWQLKKLRYREGHSGDDV